jgi:hypothetical protein
MSSTSDANWKIKFSFDEIANKSKCEICEKVFNGNHEYNLKRHFTTAHKTLSDELNVEIKKRKVDPENDSEKIKKLTKGEYLFHHIKLVTINFLTLNVLNDSSFRALKRPGYPVINSSNIFKYIELTSNSIRDIIKGEVQNRLISIKLDIGSHRYRSFLGVNCQFYSFDLGKIVIRTLGMIELNDQHTSKKLEVDLNQLFEKFSIDKRNIYSYTTDNGSNMICLGKILQSSQHDLLLGDQLKELQNTHYDIDDDIEVEDSERDDLEERHERLLSDMNQHFSNITVMRCAAHVMNLVVNDSLKNSEYDSEIHAIKQIVKNLKSSIFRNLMKTRKIPQPKSEVVTRWNTIYIMIESLRKIKLQLIELYKDSEYTRLSGKEKKEIYVSDELWEFVDDFIQAYKPPFEMTISLQSVQLLTSNI